MTLSHSRVSSIVKCSKLEVDELRALPPCKQDNAKISTRSQECGDVRIHRFEQIGEFAALAITKIISCEDNQAKREHPECNDGECSKVARTKHFNDRMQNRKDGVRFCT